MTVSVLDHAGGPALAPAPAESWLALCEHLGQPSRIRVAGEGGLQVDSFRGRVAAITGAASGIGRALACELAARGCDLALSDVNDTGLAETARRCTATATGGAGAGAGGGAGVRVTTEHVDVADREAMHRWADKAAAEHGKVNLVFNNAGVALAATVEAMSYEDLEWLMGINFWGVVHGTKAFLPHLKASGDGHVVNVSSIFGLVSVPTQGAYNAAKFAVRGFTEALRMELQIEGAPVSCTTVHPGGVKTDIVRNMRRDDSAGEGVAEAAREFDTKAMTTPEKAARQILAAVERDRRRVLVGPDAKVVDLIARLPSGFYQGLLVRGGRKRQASEKPVVERH